MFQEDDPYGFSLFDKSFSYAIFDYYHQNAAVSGSDATTSSSPPISSLTTRQTHTEPAAAAAAFYSSENKFYGGAGEVSRPRKRRRRRSEENREEVEKQRMTHIAVERNRRRQMNHFLSVLRSIMPPSFSQRGDQASIVGGAINYVKELEQNLHSLEAHKAIESPKQSVFSNFFFFPQFSTASSSSGGGRHEKPTAAAVADVEVTVVERHANIKVLVTKAKPTLVFKMVGRFHSLGLTVLHLNLTTCQHMILFTSCAKVEEDCPVTSGDDIASAVHELVRRIQCEED